MLSRQGFAVVYFPAPIVCVCIAKTKPIHFSSLPLFWLDVDAKAPRPHTPGNIIILSNYLLFLEGGRTQDVGCRMWDASRAQADRYRLSVCFCFCDKKRKRYDSQGEKHCIPHGVRAEEKAFALSLSHSFSPHPHSTTTVPVVVGWEQWNEGTVRH